MVDEQGKPLPNLLLENKNEFDTTDETGYIQAGITTAQHNLVFRSIDGDTCTVSLPDKLKPKEGVIVLDKPLVCELKPAEKEQESTKEST